MLDELIAPLGIPAIANVPVGHGKHMATMPLGAKVRIDGAAKTLEVLEAAVEPASDEPERRRCDELRRIDRAQPARRRRSPLALAVSGSATAQDDGSVLRIGWAQDPKTLNPFTGLDEEDYNVWAMNWDLLVNFDPRT